MKTKFKICKINSAIRNYILSFKLWSAAIYTLLFNCLIWPIRKLQICLSLNSSILVVIYAIKICYKTLNGPNTNIYHFLNRIILALISNNF